MDIIRGSDLERKLWRFTPIYDYLGQLSLRLCSYHEQTRLTKRHKFAGKQWSCMDERTYCSALSRPTEIPPDVLTEVVEKLIDLMRNPTVYIGWINPEHVYTPPLRES